MSSFFQSVSKSKSKAQAVAGVVFAVSAMGASVSHASNGAETLSAAEYMDFENHAVITLQEVPEFLAPDAGRKSLEGLLEFGLTDRRKSRGSKGKGLSIRREIRPSTEAESNSRSGRTTLTLEEDEEADPRATTTSSERRSRLGTSPVGRGGNPERGGRGAEEEKEKELTPLERAAEDAGTVEKIVDSVINIGKKIWAVVEAGEPVYSATYNRANALPESMNHWSQMSDWNPTPKSKIFRFSVVNLYGMTPVDFSYRITYVYGGKFNGTGSYLNDVGVETYNLSVLPMYSFDASAEVSSTSNIGTVENPNAGMRLRVKMVVKTILKHGEFTHEFFIRGNDGSLTNLTDGN